MKRDELEYFIERYVRIAIPHKYEPTKLFYLYGLVRDITEDSVILENNERLTVVALAIIRLVELIEDEEEEDDTDN
jgi:hypothetical protein